MDPLEDVPLVFAYGVIADRMNAEGLPARTRGCCHQQMVYSTLQRNSGKTPTLYQNAFLRVLGVPCSIYARFRGTPRKNRRVPGVLACLIAVTVFVKHGFSTVRNRLPAEVARATAMPRWAAA